MSDDEEDFGLDPSEIELNKANAVRARAEARHLVAEAKHRELELAKEGQGRKRRASRR
jgi:hypothetical protein